MVELTTGTLITCNDDATCQLIKYLSNEQKLGTPFILAELGSRHLFVETNRIDSIREAMNKFSDSNTYNVEGEEATFSNEK